MLQHLPQGVSPEDTVIFCDNAPCHSRLHVERCITNHPGLQILRLGPYSPMLNPVEAVWSKMKAAVKRNMRVPQVTPPQVGAQRLQYVERLIDDAMETQ